MLPGRRPPMPKSKVWAAAFIDSQTECFEMRTFGDSVSQGPYALYHKEHAIGSAVTDFLALNLSAWRVQKKELQRCIGRLNARQDEDASFLTLYDATRYWLNQSGLLAPLAAALQRLALDYEAGKKLSLDKCDKMMAYYSGLQPRLLSLAQSFFETDTPQDMRALYFRNQAERGVEQFPVLSFSKVTLSCQVKGAGGFFPYDDWLTATQKTDYQDTITELLETESPEEYVNFILYRYITENLRFRVCKYCGRYFGIMGNSKVEYCDRLIEGSTKTCRETGAFRIYTARRMEDPAVREYKRSYKAHNARIRYGLMTREEFSAWSQEARKKRDLCVAGKLSLDDFVSWLDSDKM